MDAVDIWKLLSRFNYVLSECFSEWAHFTPRYPYGLKRRCYLGCGIQRCCVRFWLKMTSAEECEGWLRMLARHANDVADAEKQRRHVRTYLESGRPKQVHSRPLCGLGEKSHRPLYPKALQDSFTLQVQLTFIADW